MPKTRTSGLKAVLYVAAPTIIFLGLVVDLVLVIATGIGMALVACLLLDQPHPDHPDDDER